MPSSGGVSVEVLELFAEVLSQTADGETAGEPFYDRLCDAVCRLARMRRAIIFRYDEASRRVRAVGAHGLDLAQFADAHVSVESAPMTAQALERDRVVEVDGDVRDQIQGIPEATDDWQATVARPDIDVVDVVTPSHTHFELAMGGARARASTCCARSPWPTTSTRRCRAAALARDEGAQDQAGLHLPLQSRRAATPRR